MACDMRFDFPLSGCIELPLAPLTKTPFPQTICVRATVYNRRQKPCIVVIHNSGLAYAAFEPIFWASSAVVACAPLKASANFGAEVEYRIAVLEVEACVADGFLVECMFSHLFTVTAGVGICVAIAEVGAILVLYCGVGEDEGNLGKGHVVAENVVGTCRFIRFLDDEACC